MNQVGIGLKVNAEASGVQNVNTALQDTAQGFTDIAGQVRATTDEIERYHDAVEEAISQGVGPSGWPTVGGAGGGPAFGGPSAGGGGGEGQGGGAAGGGDSDDDERGRGRIIPFPGVDLMRMGKTLKRLPGGLSKDVGNEVAGAAEGLAGQMGQMWSKIPVAGKALGAAGVVGAIGIGVANELSKQYEAVIPAVMSSTAALGRFGKTAEEQTGKFRSTMSEISGVSAKYGFSLKQGAAVVESLARGGARGDAALKGAENVLAFSRGYGFSDAQDEFTSLYASASRYKLGGGDALAYAAGGARRTVGDARATEYADAMNSILEDGLAEGVIKGFDEISGTQNFLYSMFGEKAGGQRGAEMYAQLSGSIRGATGLQTETDLLLYQAAKGSLGEGATPTDIIIKMEEGFSADIFKNFMKGIDGAEDKEFLIQKAFGVSLTQAREMMNAKTDEDLSKAYKGEAPGGAIVDTNEVRLSRYQEQIAEYMREFGTKAFDAKTGVMSGVDMIGKLLTGEITLPELLEINTEVARINAQDLQVIQNTRELEGKRKTDKTIDPYADGSYGEVIQNLRNKLDFVYGDLLYAVAQKNKGPDAQSLSNLLYDQKNWDKILNVGDEKMKQILGLNNAEKGDWTANEISAALAMLTEVLKENSAATRDNTGAQTEVKAVIPMSVQNYLKGGVGAR